MSYQSILRKVRIDRGFSVEEYLSKKVKLINDFFTNSKLDNPIVGLSGGIDSALVYYLLVYASQEDNSNIKEVTGVCMPIFGEGATNQEETYLKSSECWWHLNNEKKISKATFEIRDLTKVYNEYIKHYKNIDSWVQGQILSIVRTPMIYGIAARQQHKGLKSIVVGTTNMDEGSYIGFYGKASDGMVDLQLIADLHKSEVFALAKYLGVPQSILNSVPRGDVHDGRNDEEMIGSDYETLEIWTELLQKNNLELLNEFCEIPGIYNKVANIEYLHAINYHKYQVGMPSHFLDVMDRTVPNGWSK